MYILDRLRQGLKAQNRHQSKTTQDEEQLRLGQLLYEALKPLAEQNTKVGGGGKISAGTIEKNAGCYSVIISFRSGSFRDTMLQFDINVADNRLSTGRKYQTGPQFTVDQFDEFLETAKTMVRDFR